MKKVNGLLLALLLSLVIFDNVYCKGLISDFDSFETYIGKSKPQVKLINSKAIEMTNELWIVDYRKVDDETLTYLLVLCNN